MMFLTNHISRDNILSFRWQSLLHAIPIEWKRYLKLISEVGDISDKVSNMCVNKLKSANVYNALISNFCKEPSVVGKIKEKGITNWQSVYEYTNVQMIPIYASFNLKLLIITFKWRKICLNGN